MQAPNSIHPSDRTLNDYGLGKLDDELASTVHEHLEGCQDCRQRVSEFTADSFVGRFREVRKPTERSIPGGTLEGGTLSFVPAKPTSPPPATDTLPPGLANHPDYEIRRELGRGGMGVVYLAHNAMMGRDEVLKVMGRHIMERPGVLERFQREIRAVAKLRHPNIVAAYHAFRIEGGLVFSMEYVEGLDLSRLVKTKGPLTVAHAAYFAHQAALGLQHAHERGLIHRDIKPHNLMLTHDGKARLVKVLDFGLAKATREEKVDGGLTSEGQALGTPDYIAPEQIVNALDVDIRADLYSLGGTLFNLLTGRPPFQAESLYDIYQAHMSRDAEPLNLIRPEVPTELAALVAKMMAKEPVKRFQTPAEVAAALTPFFKPKSIKVQAETSRVGADDLGPSTDIGVEAATDPASRDVTPIRRPKGRVEPAATDWDGLIDLRGAGSAREVGPSRATVGRLRRVGPRVAVAALLASVLGGWLAWDVFVKTKDGTIVLTDVPKDAKVLVDGERVEFTWAGEAEPVKIRAVPGRHKLEVARDGFKTYGEVLTFERGGSGAVTVRLVPLVVDRSGAKDAPQTHAASVSDVINPNQERARTKYAITVREDGFIPLFNGKDLAGWKTHDDQPGNWRVENGLLVGSGSEISHLYTERADFRDVHLRVKARVNDGGGGGVYIRTGFGATRPEAEPKFGDGYELALNATSPNPNRTGSVYGPDGQVLAPVAESPVPFGRWTILEVVASGGRVVCKVDGMVTADLEDSREDRPGKNHIALLQYRPNTVIEICQVEIKEGGVEPFSFDPKPPPVENAAELAQPAKAEEVLPARDAAKPGDLLQPGTVWTGSRSYRKGGYAGITVSYFLHVRERDGRSFRGHKFDNGAGRNRVEVVGEVVGPVIRWTERDAGGDLKITGTLVGGSIVLSFQGVYANGVRTQGDGKLALPGFAVEEKARTAPDLPEVPTTANGAGRVPENLLKGQVLHDWSAWGPDGPLGHPESEAIWSVRDGVLQGRGGPSHLFSPRGDYRDFRLRANVRINEGGNSGIYFRTAEMAGFPKGYEAQINSTHRDPVKTGSLYGIANIKEILVRPDTWFALEVEAIGNHIKIWVDGRPQVDLHDPRMSYARGHFAIQAHHPGSLVEIRELNVMEVGAAGPPVAPSTAETLKKRVPLRFPDGITIRRFVEEVRKATQGPGDPGLPIYVDLLGVQDADKSLESLVAIDLERQALGSALRKALDPLGLDFCIMEGVVFVSCKESVEAERDRAVVVPHDATPESREVLAALERRLPMRFASGIAIKDMPTHINRSLQGAGAARIDIHPDRAAIEDADKSMDSKATIDLEGIPLRVTLRLWLRAMGMDYYVKEGVLTLSSREFFPAEFK